MEAAGLDRSSSGISQGCALSVEYTLRHPEKVAGLFIGGDLFVDGERTRECSGDRQARSDLGPDAPGLGQDDPLFRQMFTNLFIPGANRVQMDWFNELQRRTLTPENALRLSFAFADIDISRSLERLHVPALILHANGDRVAPLSEGLELARTITGARFVELDSANHILLAEEPAFRDFVLEASAFANDALQGAVLGRVDPRTRRQATILCADFRYAEQVWRGLPPDVALERVDPFLMQASRTCARQRGTVLTISENELVASFGAPEPLEGHAALACRTALALRELALQPCRLDDGSVLALDTGIVIFGPARDQASEVRGGPVSVAHSSARRCGAVSSWRPPGPRHPPAALSACGSAGSAAAIGIPKGPAAL